MVTWTGEEFWHGCNEKRGGIGEMGVVPQINTKSLCLLCDGMPSFLYA